MSKLPFILFLFFCFSLTLFAQKKEYQKIAILESLRFEAMTKKDVLFLDDVLTEDVTYAHSNGLVENKQQHLDNVRSGRITYTTMAVEESNIRIYHKTAVNTGIIKVDGLYRETPFSIRLGFTDVYVKKKGKWKLAAWQSVKLE